MTNDELCHDLRYSPVTSPTLVALAVKGKVLNYNEVMQQRNRVKTIQQWNLSRSKNFNNVSRFDRNTPFAKYVKDNRVKEQLLNQQSVLPVTITDADMFKSQKEGRNVKKLKKENRFVTLPPISPTQKSSLIYQKPYYSGVGASTEIYQKGNKHIFSSPFIQHEKDCPDVSSSFKSSSNESILYKEQKSKLKGIPQNKVKLNFIMAGTKVELDERFDITQEILKLKALVLPDFARDLLHGRGVTLPMSHRSMKPKKSLQDLCDKLEPNPLSLKHTHTVDLIHHHHHFRLSDSYQDSLSHPPSINGFKSGKGKLAPLSKMRQNSKRQKSVLSI